MFLYLIQMPAAFGPGIPKEECCQVMAVREVEDGPEYRQAIHELEEFSRTLHDADCFFQIAKSID